MASGSTHVTERFAAFLVRIGFSTIALRGQADHVGDLVALFIHHELDAVHHDPCSVSETGNQISIKAKRPLEIQRPLGLVISRR